MEISVVHRSDLGDPLLDRLDPKFVRRSHLDWEAFLMAKRGHRLRDVLLVDVLTYAAGVAGSAHHRPGTSGRPYARLRPAPIRCSRTASAVTSSARRALLRLRAATPTNKQSITVS
jgi:hypothetical protein